ncbi:MAG TPA: hypothetical protein VLV49_19390, partial [Terriglobales bacterium]|nr:hypothetical protein [Terriglobales bacterium]
MAIEKKSLIKSRAAAKKVLLVTATEGSFGAKTSGGLGKTSGGLGKTSGGLGKTSGGLGKTSGGLGKTS